MGAHDRNRGALSFIRKGVAMRWLRTWLTRLDDMLHRHDLQSDLAQEIEANLQLQIDDNIRSGMTSDEARRAARIKFGSIEATKEQVRERRGIPFLETLARDIHYAVRMLRQNMKWSTVAILSLALGIGANTAIFNAVNGLFLKHLPVAQPERLVRLRWAGSNDMATSSGDYGYSGKNAAGQDIH